jgi:uncharacterized protein
MTAPPASGGEPAPNAPRLPGAAAKSAMPPDRLPIFPLSGVVLLPRARLPLNIFEPRYLAMTRDAIAGQPYIGMVQPISGATTDPPSPERSAGFARAGKPAVFGVGCAGRIVEWRDASEGRMLITLSGVCRFQIVAELGAAAPYRVVDASYAPFAADLGDDGAGALDRASLLRTLKAYLGRRKFKADFEVLSRAPAGELVNWLTMALPFSHSEKQALLEAADLAQRAALMIHLMQLALLESAGGAAGAVH